MTLSSLISSLARKIFFLLRHTALALFVLLALYGLGRVIQLSLDNVYQDSRGPYLQMLSDNAVTIRWQSAEAQLGTLHYGRDPSRLNKQATGQDTHTEHELRLEGLAPLTRYYYRIDGQVGGHGSFVTAPPPGEETTIRLWVTGDQGELGVRQSEVRDAAWQWLADNPRPNRAAIDFWLTTGDNAYRSGTQQQFQKKFFEPYAEILRDHTVWPAYGNHDARRWAFFDIFSLPTQGESGGLPSHTEHYYSFDYGQLHVVMLDSEASNLSSDGPMARWLEADLKATNQPWRIVVLHHPPYTKGSHDSDRHSDSGGRLTRVRENIVPLLERLGVDLMLTGHSHSYERSHAIACHYQDSSTWGTQYLRDDSSPYRKGSGVIQMVVGSSAKLDVAALDHPAMPVSLNQAGSVIIDIEGDVLSARFINQQGEISDQFQIARDEHSPAGLGIDCAGIE